MQFEAIGRAQTVMIDQSNAVQSGHKRQWATEGNFDKFGYSWVLKLDPSGRFRQQQGLRVFNRQAVEGSRDEIRQSSMAVGKIKCVDDVEFVPHRLVPATQVDTIANVEVKNDAMFAGSPFGDEPLESGFAEIEGSGGLEVRCWIGWIKVS